VGRRIPIRVRVAAVVAVPLLVLVAGAAIGVVTSTSEARTVTRQADLAAASLGHAGLINVLQDERNAALVRMLGLGNEIELEEPDVDASRQRTDAAREALHRQVSGHDDRLREDWANALSTLDDLPGVRAEVDVAAADPGPANRETAHEVFAEYTDMVAATFASHDRFVLVVDDAALRQGDDLVHYSSHATDSAAQLVDQLLYLGWGTTGIDEPVAAAHVAEVARDVEGNNAAVKTRGTGDYAAPTDRLLADPQVAGLVPFASDAVASGEPVDAADLLATAPLGADGPYPAFRDQVADVRERRADDLRSEADARRRWYIGAVLAAGIVASFVAWRVSRSITRPLRALSRDAQSIADEQLPRAMANILDAPTGRDLEPPEPVPIEVTTSDEVSDVAEALDDVQRSALGLAVEQATLRRTIAESYVNLGRRNQNLLSRLLAAIGRLEQDETDPERIGQLHRVDHLATRMRRSAESLLVLSQVDVAPHWHPPVRVLDVVRAALGEIENYQRVVMRTLDPAMIVGGAASDLTHLLAELIENGVKHSPPHELVEIRGRLTPDGYSLAVVDHGLGMGADDIAMANQRLAGAEAPTVALSKHLGHFVTGALAARNGIGVRLQGSEVVGIAAIIDLPAAIVGPVPPEPIPELAAPASPAALAGPPPPEALAEASAPRAGSAGPPSASPSPDPAPNPIPVGGGTPAVTASGLVRRVRGAQHPGATGPLGSAGRTPAIQPAAPLDDRGPGVDPAEIQRFLTSLASGVHRSLADTDTERDQESQ
jgi:signal transduction histidine kinase